MNEPFVPKKNGRSTRDYTVRVQESRGGIEKFEIGSFQGTLVVREILLSNRGKYCREKIWIKKEREIGNVADVPRFLGIFY